MPTDIFGNSFFIYLYENIDKNDIILARLEVGMDKVGTFKRAVEEIESSERYFSEEDETNYLSKTSNWCLVHATGYMPINKPDGTMYIPSTAMATNFEIPRTTIHTTINHVVSSNDGGSWDDTPIVILMPYDDVVQGNKTPAEISAVDTYWSVNPDKGLVLPASTCIIQPNNDTLYNIGEHGATYKIGNYTPEEEDAIVSLLSPAERVEYEKYANGDFQQWEIDEGLDKGADIKKEAILTKFLRDAVVKLAMQKMGFKKTSNHYDGSKPNEVVVKVAESMGIRGKGSDKGHSDSLYYKMEDFNVGLHKIFHGLAHDGGLLDFDAPEEVYNFIVENRELSDMHIFSDSIINNKPIDFYKLYCDRASAYLSPAHFDKKTLAEFDKNLDETIRRHCQQLTKKYDAWRTELARKPEYENLVQKLRAFEQAQIRKRAGRDEY